MQITILHRSTHLSGAVMASVTSRTRTLEVIDETILTVGHRYDS